MVARLSGLFLLIFFSLVLRGQIILEFHQDDNDQETTLLAKDSSQAVRLIMNFYYQRLKQGYLFAGLDSVIHKSSKWMVYGHLGDKMNAIVYGILSEGVGPNIRLKKEQGLFKYIDKKLIGYANSGFPFATVRVDTLIQKKGQIQAQLIIDEGPLITYDSLQFTQPVSIQPKFIARSLGIEYGDSFSESQYSRIEQGIARLKSIKMRQPPAVYFSDGLAHISLDLKNQKVNSAEGILGLQPSEPGGSGELMLIGMMNLNLYNLARTDREFHMKWTRFQEMSQELYVGYSHPYFMNSKLQLDMAIEILKQDSLFSSRNFDINFGLFLNHNFKLLLGVNREVSNLLGSNEFDISLLGYKNMSYQMEIKYNNSDPIITNNDHWNGSLKGAIGEKRIAATQTIPAWAEDNLTKNSIDLEVVVESNWQKSISQNWALSHKVIGGYMYNKQLTKNEFYRLGGMNSIRGFNEMFFFAQNYLIQQIEGRYFFEEQSYLNLFYDSGLLSDGSDNETLIHWPHGFGGGLNLNTGNGQFHFIFAFGRTKNISPSFSEVKIHFGYQARF